MFSACSYLQDVTAELDSLVRVFDSANVAVGVLKAIHWRTESVLKLLMHRLSIIQAVAHFDAKTGH